MPAIGVIKIFEFCIYIPHGIKREYNPISTAAPFQGHSIQFTIGGLYQTSVRPAAIGIIKIMNPGISSAYSVIREDDAIATPAASLVGHPIKFTVGSFDHFSHRVSAIANK